MSKNPALLCLAIQVVSCQHPGLAPGPRAALATQPAAPVATEIQPLGPSAPRWTYDGDDFGYALLAIGDVDGDGRCDFAVGAPEQGDVGGVWVVSGARGEILYDVPAPEGVTDFGHALCLVADMDGDGVDDYAVAARGELGYISIQSGRTGTSLFEHAGVASARIAGSVAFLEDVAGNDGAALILSFRSDGKWPRDYWLGAIALNGELLWQTEPVREGGYRQVELISDWNGDGVADIAATRSDFSVHRSRVELRCGRKGTLFHTLDPGEYGFGRVLRSGGDVDGDWSPDLLIGTADDGQYEYASVRTYTSPSGVARDKLEFGPPRDQFGESVGFIGDIDGDGCDDYAAVVGNTIRPASLRIYSSKEPRWLYTITGPSSPQFGHAVIGLGDINGDGVPDLAVSIVSQCSPGRTLGLVRVFSGVDGDFLYQVSRPLTQAAEPRELAR